MILDKCLVHRMTKIFYDCSFFSFLTQLVLSMVSSNDSEVKYQKKSYTYLALSANFFGNTFGFFLMESI